MYVYHLLSWLKEVVQVLCSKLTNVRLAMPLFEYTIIFKKSGIV